MLLHGCGFQKRASEAIRWNQEPLGSVDLSEADFRQPQEILVVCLGIGFDRDCHSAARSERISTSSCMSRALVLKIPMTLV